MRSGKGAGYRFRTDKRMKIDQNLRIMLSAIIMIVVYILMTILLKPFFISEQKGMMGMMSFSNPNYMTLNVLSVLIGVLAGLAFYLMAKQPEHDKDNEMKIIKKALSEDERHVIGEIERAGEITQDSLRFRLSWSKAKISTILTNLDKMNLIQRERQGKTYNVFLSNPKSSRHKLT